MKQDKELAAKQTSIAALCLFIHFLLPQEDGYTLMFLFDTLLYTGVFYLTLMAIIQAMPDSPEE